MKTAKLVPYSYRRWVKGEALDLILEADKDIEINHESTNNQLSKEFLKEQEIAERKYLNNYYEAELNE